jgi:hypothetical protein
MERWINGNVPNTSFHFFIRINFQCWFVQFSYLFLFFKLVFQRDGIAICTFSVCMSDGFYGYFIIPTKPTYVH